MGRWKALSPEDLSAHVDAHVKRYQEKTWNFFGYPRNLLVHSEVEKQLDKLRPYGVHNVGSGHSQFPLDAFEVEREVVGFFMDLWKCPNPNLYVGHVEPSGSIANIWGITVGMKALKERYESLGDPVVILSQESHYSFDTAFLMCGLQIELVPANTDGSINIDELKAAFAKYQNRPIIMAAMCGTTVKEGHDNLSAILDAIRDTRRPRKEFFVHVDAAYSGVPLALMDDAPHEITPSFIHDVDSIMTSGAKFIGCRDPAGIFVMRQEYRKFIRLTASYLDTGVERAAGSMGAKPIWELWLLIKYLGHDKLKKWAYQCLEQAQEFARMLREKGIEDVILNKFATTVYIPKPSQEIMDKFNLAPDGDYCHVIHTPHTLPEHLGGFGVSERFLKDFFNESSRMR